MRLTADLLRTTFIALAAGLALQPAAAAEFDVSGSGSFKPLTAEQLDSLPSGLPFSRADLASGRWSFTVRYDDGAADVDADPYAGRYAGAIRSFRVTVGDTTIELPATSAELLVSDGGGAARQRETIRLEAAAATAAGTLRAGWVQLHQKSRTDDLRGAAGLLAGDAMPAPPAIANLATASPFDRFFYVRIDAADGARKPQLYLSSSRLTVAAAAAADAATPQ
jgi:hypothetical protein